MSDEDRAARGQKISESVRLAMSDPAVREKLRAARSGKPLTEAQSAVLAMMSMRNRKSEGGMTDARKAALAAVQKGNVGRRRSEESKAKMRAARVRVLDAKKASCENN